MSNFNMAAAFSSGFAFVKENLVLCLIMAAIGVIVPQVMQLMVIGSDMAALMNPQSMAGAGGLAAMASLGASFFLVSIIGVIIQYGTMFAAWRGGLDNDVPLMSALVYGLIAGATSLIAIILVGIATVVPLFLIVGGSMGALISGGGEMPGAGTFAFAGLAVLLWALFMVWLSGRLIASGPWMADNASYNPFTGLANAWRLSAQGQWAIFGYLLLLLLVYLVFAFIIGIVTGASAAGAMMTGGADPAAGFGQIMTISTIIGIVVGIPIALVGYAITMGIYLSLRESNTESIFG